MTIKAELDLAKALIDVLEKDVVQPDGSIVFNSVKQDLVLAQDVEAAFKAAGIAVPADVDKVLQGAIALVTVLGLK